MTVLKIFFLIGTFSFNLFPTQTFGQTQIESVTTLSISSESQSRFPTFTQYKSTLKKTMIQSGFKTKVRKGKRYLLKVAHNNGRGLAGYLSFQTDPIVTQIFKLHSKEILETVSDDNKNQARIFLRNNTSSQFLESKSSVDENETVDSKLNDESVFLGSWNVKGYPSVVSSMMVRAWIEIIQEWGGEAWVGDQSGIPSPNTYKNFKESGVFNTIKEAGGFLWIFDKGLVDFKSETEAYITVLNRQSLNTFTRFHSVFLKSYGGEAKIAEALSNDFFDGIVFASFPKSHFLTRITNTMKNFVGLMHSEERRKMHHIENEKLPPATMIFTHNKISDYMISEMTFALKNYLDSKIIGYIGDSVATLSIGGPDLGSPVIFKSEDWTVTASRSLLAHEVATLYTSFSASRRYLKDKSFKKITFNKYFKKKNPFEYRILKHYLEIADTNNQKANQIKWSFEGSPELKDEIKILLKKQTPLAITFQ